MSIDLVERNESEKIPCAIPPVCSGQFVGECVRARVWRAGAWEEVAAAEVAPGDVVSHMEFKETPAVMFRVEFEGGQLT